jgi:hypothetical protein
MRTDSKGTARDPRGAQVWIRFDDGFPVRACRLIDLSSSGIRIMVDAPYDVADRFSLMLSRNGVPGWRCRVKWRNGPEIGAEFIGAKK